MDVYLSMAAAQREIDPKRPLAAGTVRIWHDRLNGPRDTSGRRVWTPEICRQIREAREAARRMT